MGALLAKAEAMMASAKGWAVAHPYVDGVVSGVLGTMLLHHFGHKMLAFLHF